MVLFLGTFYCFHYSIVIFENCDLSYLNNGVHLVSQVCFLKKIFVVQSLSFFGNWYFFKGVILTVLFYYQNVIN